MELDRSAHRATSPASEKRATLEELHRRLRSDLRVHFDENELELALADGELTLRGETSSIAQKRAAVACAHTSPGIARVVDEIRVKSPVVMLDDEIRVRARNALLGEPAFAELSLHERDADAWQVLRDLPNARGSIRLDVRDGVVTLRGEVPSLSHSRLAGVLCWWIPGTRDVDNELRAAPPEADGEEEITDAVRIALEKDPLLDESGISVRTEDHNVRLTGAVRTDAQRQMAENDALFVWGVADVIDELEVVPIGSGATSRAAQPVSRSPQPAELRKRSLRPETVPTFSRALEALSAEGRHLEQEHVRTHEKGSWRRRFSKQLRELQQRFTRTLNTLQPNDRERQAFLRPLHRRPTPDAVAPRALRYHGRSQAGNVLEVWQRADGTFDVEVDHKLVRRASSYWAVAQTTPRLTLLIDDVEYAELFEVNPQALEALERHTHDPASGPPTAWARALREAGLIDPHFGLTARGRRCLAARR